MLRLAAHYRILFLLILPFMASMVFLSCLTATEKRIVEAPWTPSLAEAAASRIRPPVDEVVPVHWNTEAPVIDGQFDEWAGLDGPVTRIVVFGSYHNPEDAEARFALRTDGVNLYIYAEVTDDVVNENKLPGAMAWRSDSVEIFFGTDTSRHVGYRLGDSQIRIVPRNSEDPFDYELAINDIQQVKNTNAAVVFTETGYELEAAIPLELMQIYSLRPGQKIRCEFQINDADSTERDRLVHWMGEFDNPWFDASTWGDGIVTDE